MIIIIVLNLNSGVVLEQKLSHWSMLRSRAELIRVNIKIKVVIIIILNSIRGSIQGKTWATSEVDY
jgi:hypothetical protein